jgi:hypothetical protein
VRRLVAATLFVLFASLNAIDGICCPDGCTTTFRTSSASQHSMRSALDEYHEDGAAKAPNELDPHTAKSIVIKR